MKITEAELSVLEAIWKVGKRCALVDIRSNLSNEKEWKTSTICTMLTRLEKKGAVLKEKDQVYLYTALISKDEYIQSEVEKIDKLLKGNVKHLFAAFCSAENLTKTDIEEIDDLWQKKKEEMLHHE